MSNDKGVKAVFTNLVNCIKVLNKGIPVVQVGILGDKNHRNKGEEGNAEIGFQNEFGKMTGYPKIPQRSFIRYPLNAKFKEFAKKKESLTREAFEKSVEEGKGDEFAKKVGSVAEEVIQTAFSTQGWGKWPDNAPLTISLKGSDKPLIDTGQLRRSISSRLKK